MLVKCYIAVSGTLFALLVVAHIARYMAEGAHLLGEPIFIAATVGSIGMAGWAAFLLFRSRGGSK